MKPASTRPDGPGITPDHVARERACVSLVESLSMIHAGAGAGVVAA